MFYSTSDFGELPKILRFLILAAFGDETRVFKGVERLDYILPSMVEDCFATLAVRILRKIM